MPELTVCGVDLTDLLWHSAGVSRYACESPQRRLSKNDRIVRGPATVGRYRKRVAKGHTQVGGQLNLLELSMGKECNPLVVMGEKRAVRILCSRDHSGLSAIEIAPVQLCPAGMVDDVNEKSTVRRNGKALMPLDVGNPERIVRGEMERNVCRP